MGKVINAYNILVGNLKGRDHLRDLGIARWMIVKRILKN
jgi:hypothetical protein